jgi:hypothetical protein
MKDVKGLNINHLGFNPLKLGDFIYYEGPLLSHFIDRNKPEDNYLYRWVDFDDNAHRWLIFKASEKDLLAFFNGELSLKQMIENNNFITLLDLDDELNKVQILISPSLGLPDNYLPSEQSFFKEELYHTYATQLKQTLFQKQQDNSLLVKLLDRVRLLEEQQTKTYNLLANVLNPPLRSGV